MNHLIFSMVLMICGVGIAQAQTDDSVNILDELNPFDPNIEEILQNFDEDYEADTGESASLPGFMIPFGQTDRESSCFRQSCPLWVQVVRSSQVMYVYENGSLVFTWKVSTGTPGSETPNFDRNPNGRIYNRYTSKKHPGGDYKGLGNMPYAVFIHAGFAIHGTAEINWKKLGRKASHGCVRLHPDHAFYFNQQVRSLGVRNVWITVQE